MSSNIIVQRICEHCGNLFDAKTTVTKYCSHLCVSRAAKSRARAKKIEVSNNETKKLIVKPIEELKVKPYLSISEACLLFGISRRTIYRMISRKELGVAKAGTRCILKQSDFEALFSKESLELNIKPKSEVIPIAEFYTVAEIEKIYSIKYGRLHTIIKEKNIPHTMHIGKLMVSKTHIDRYFKLNRPNLNHINDWYSVSEIIEKFGLTRDQVYSRVHDNNVPKLRLGKNVKISQKHFDELFIIGV